MKYKYGNSWEKYPIEPGEVWGIENGSKIAVHNIFDKLPGWMKADLLFVDPPWNQGNLSCFYTKADRNDYQEFEKFADVLFQRIVDIGADTAYIEIGNQMVFSWLKRLEFIFPYTQAWNVTYYKKYPTNIIRGSLLSKVDYDFTGIDEKKCIDIIANIEAYKVIADPCIGQGLVGLAAYKAKKPFVGTELNKRRLAVLVDKISKLGGEFVKTEL